MITNIGCEYEEYRKVNGVWLLVNKEKSMVSSPLIQSMIRNQPNFVKLGGKAETKYKFSKKFGKVVKEVVCLSVDKQVKCKYRFIYCNARQETSRQLLTN